MKLRYEKICKENIKLAAKIQYEIFPNSSAYLKYLKDIDCKNELPVDFLVYNKTEPIGVIGLYQYENDENIWLSYFGILKKYRNNGYGKQIFYDMVDIAKKFNKKYLRLYTYEVWNSVAQRFYKKHMQKEEYYTNEDDDQFDIKEGIPKIFSYSLTGDKITLWNNKYIGLDLDDKDHDISILKMKQDGILKEYSNGNNR